MPRTREPITGYVGPMFALKTDLLLHEIQAADAVGYQTFVFKPEADDRYGPDVVKSRGGRQHQAFSIPPTNPEIVYEYLKKRQKDRVIAAFDEVQFNHPRIARVIRTIAQSGIEVVFCGLNRDYRGNPFPTMENVMPLATRLQMMEARCMFPLNGNNRHLCGADAQFTQRLVNGQPDSYHSPTVIIQKPGTDIAYEARCHNHWIVPDMPRSRKF